jgi:hypothetical protein
LLRQSREATNQSSALTDVVNRSLEPPVPSSAQLEHQEELAGLQAERECAAQRSWTEFIANLKRDPDQLRRLAAPTRENGAFRDALIGFGGSGNLPRGIAVVG